MSTNVPLSPESLLSFWTLAIRLKQLSRQGWLDRGVHDPESSADHSWGVALLAWLLAGSRPELNRDRILLLGLIHDLPESLAGDTTPFDARRDPSGAIPIETFLEAPAYTDDERQKKAEAEADALEKMLDGLPGNLATEVRGVWHEYEAGESAEARFVRQVDKLETLLQAEAYGAAQPELVIDSFRLGTRRDVTDAGLAHLIEALAGHGPRSE